MTSPAVFILGTRGSPLALAQANEARRRLARGAGVGGERDRAQDHPHERRCDPGPAAGGGGRQGPVHQGDRRRADGGRDRRGRPLRQGSADVMPAGVAIAGFLPREDVRDALVSSFADTIEGLPQGASLGAASLRRQAQALRLRPDLRPQLLRGNVETRLKKAEQGAVGATLLAMAGLKRLGLVYRARAAARRRGLLPAVGQGAIALTARSGDARDARGAGAGRRRQDGLGACRRARLSRRARRLLPDADRRPRPNRGRPAQVPGPGAADRRLGELRDRGEGPASEAARIGAEAGRELAARLPAGVLGG